MNYRHVINLSLSLFEEEEEEEERDDDDRVCDDTILREFCVRSQMRKRRRTQHPNKQGFGSKNFFP